MAIRSGLRTAIDMAPPWPDQGGHFYRVKTGHFYCRSTAIWFVPEEQRATGICLTRHRESIHDREKTRNRFPVELGVLLMSLIGTQLFLLRLIVLSSARLLFHV